MKRQITLILLILLGALLFFYRDLIIQLGQAVIPTNREVNFLIIGVIIGANLGIVIYALITANTKKYADGYVDGYNFARSSLPKTHGKPVEEWEIDFEEQMGDE